MLLRPFTPVLLALPFVSGSDVPSTSIGAPAEVVVQNDTYSSLLIGMVDEVGGEIALGQAPPEFSNTLIVKEPLPDGSVRLVARLVGESDVLYRSNEIRLRAGRRVRWKLPENRIER